jgi:hypothetical protein
MVHSPRAVFSCVCASIFDTARCFLPSNHAPPSQVTKKKDGEEEDNCRNEKQIETAKDKDKIDAASYADGQRSPMSATNKKYQPVINSSLYPENEPDVRA